MATLYATEPLPGPDPPPVMVTQAESLVAVHGHPGAVPTPIVPVPPTAGATMPVPPSVIAHGAAACVMVNSRLPMATCAARAEASRFAATDNPTLPLPVPEAPEVMVIQGASDDAVQSQPDAAVTGAVPLAPLLEPSNVGKLTPTEQVSPSCVTVKV